MIGKIKAINETKGYGFIIGEDNNEYFFHRSSCIANFDADLKPGRKVQFDDFETPKGKRAESVVLMNGK